jgi:hypothetical protein
MWTSIKSGAAWLWSAGKTWISKPDNQKLAIDQGKKLIDDIQKKGK